MNQSVITENTQTFVNTQQILNFSAKSWFSVAIIGQLIFVLYILMFYGSSTLQGDLEAWNKVLPHGYIAGDTLGNLMVGLHILFAAIITVGGPIQLIPHVRNKFPKLHRWTGRTYILTALLISFNGLYMMATRGAIGAVIQNAALVINGIFIIVFALLAFQTAIKKRFDAHRRWAIRLFLVVSGVWFFRIGLMLWLMIHQAPVGFDPKTFTGPTLVVLNFAQFLLPLFIAEGYFRAQKSGSGAQLTMSVIILVGTLATTGGIFAATMGMWLPRM